MLKIVSAKSRFHPYGVNHRAHFQNKVWRRSLFASPSAVGIEMVKARPSVETLEWTFDEIVFNEGQERCFNILKSKKKQFFHYIGGQAGTGKSVVLRQFAEYVRRYFRCGVSCFVTAPVGKAAQLVGGVTIHTLLKFFPSHKAFTALPVTQLDALAENLRELRVLIIDEISLLTSLLLAQADVRLREVFGNDVPFGGVSIVVFGDLLQLPAVSTLKEVVKIGGVDVVRSVGQCVFHAIPRAYEPLYNTLTVLENRSSLWKRFEMDELTENVRTSCPLERRVLEEVRMGVRSELTMDYLVSRCRMAGDSPADLHRELRRLRADDPEGEYVILAVKNERVDAINNWIATNSTRCVEIEPLSECPSCTRYARIGVKKTVRLIVGGQAVITDNHGAEDPSLANGVSGVVMDVGKDHILFKRSDNRKMVRITRFPYRKSNRPSDPVCFQFPIAMAEAITVHKSQGSTYEGSVIDSAGMDWEAMFYTALSRNRSLERTRIVNVEKIRYRGSETARDVLVDVRASTARRRRGFCSPKIKDQKVSLEAPLLLLSEVVDVPEDSPPRSPDVECPVSEEGSSEKSATEPRKRTAEESVEKKEEENDDDDVVDVTPVKKAKFDETESEQLVESVVDETENGAGTVVAEPIVEEPASDEQSAEEANDEGEDGEDGEEEGQEEDGEEENGAEEEQNEQ
ncbi:unnamed protein product [Caenorhabditis nigoni]